MTLPAGSPFTAAALAAIVGAGCSSSTASSDVSVAFVSTNILKVKDGPK